MSPSDDSIGTPSSETIELALAGNDEAFAHVYTYYHKRIFQYVFGLMGDKESASELTQQTFLQLWQKKSSVRHAAALPSFLYTIARNLVYDHGRRSKKRPPLLSTEEIETYPISVSIPSLEDNIIDKELVKLALAELPQKHRDCLLLQIIGGFSLEEIAKLLGIKKESVSTYLCQARIQFGQVYRHLTVEIDLIEKGK